MIIIRFPDAEAKRRALGYLPGRFSFTSWKTGEMLLPEAALPYLAAEGIRFSLRAQRHMSKGLLRCEMLLPLRFNDDKPVPNQLIAQTLEELEIQFGSVTAETQILRGYWRHEGQAFRDDLVRVYVDVPDTRKNRQFFKELLKERFKQAEIWMVTYPVKPV